MRIASGLIFLMMFASLSFGQSGLPEPGPARQVRIPGVVETRLANGLRVAVVERKNVPIVSAQLVFLAGSQFDGAKKAGLAGITVTMLTKGTATRTAARVASDMEFLGSPLASGSDANKSFLGFTVTSDKFGAALQILGDIAANPRFSEAELELLKSQLIDGLKYDLTQPGFLASFVANERTFGNTPSGGTLKSLESMARADIAGFRQRHFRPENAVLIVSGDIRPEAVRRSAEAAFGRWKAAGPQPKMATAAIADVQAKGTVGRIFVVDLPDSGQAAVAYAALAGNLRRADPGSFYPALVLNSVFGGGYSSRLNQEIRIKRGLSYGAGSSFSWMGPGANFGARSQTKNESAAEVAAIIADELRRIAETDVTEAELGPRKLVLTGDFGRDLETSAGLVESLASLVSHNLPASELNSHMDRINGVRPRGIREFAARYLLGGDIVIAGDYRLFREDLAKRFPGVPVTVIPAGTVGR